MPKRVAAVILNSLKGGVVPRIGLPYITVGREVEIRALLTDLESHRRRRRVFRFLVGRYGAGKSFLLQTIRTHAMGEGFVVADADLSPERRLQGGQGQGLATYRELIRNISTKTRPEGGALNLILDRWVASCRGRRRRGIPSMPNSPRSRKWSTALTSPACSAATARPYPRATRRAMTHVTKWIRGEYRTKSEARAELGSSTIISDDDWYDYVKLMARFLVCSGYKGMLVLIDELVNLYKIPNAITRQYNYEKILTMYNDTLQGKAQYLGMIMGGTPTSIEDRRRGVFSYEALRSRLAQGRFAREDLKDMLAPIIRLQPLTYEELLVLIEKLMQIHAGYFGWTPTLTENDLVDFLKIEFGRVGADTHLTPREVIATLSSCSTSCVRTPMHNVAELLQSVGGDAWRRQPQQTTPALQTTTATSPNSPSNLPKRDRFILAGFIWANAEAVMQQTIASRVESSFLRGGPVNAFDRYAPFIQDFIYSHDWESLRSIQVAAADAIFNTQDNVLLTASTASGKTEAAFFPILTEFWENPPASVGALYIGPLKALINDQFVRLNDLCEEADIPVWHWHGDVSQSHKAKLIKKPSGILQITPESLEALSNP